MTMPIVIRSVLYGGLFAAVASCSGTGLPSPGSELNTGTALLDITDAIVSLREDDANIQAQIDSLREVVARQDTLIRNLANLLGSPMP